jgi:hypothetical protein
MTSDSSQKVEQLVEQREATVVDLEDYPDLDLGDWIWKMSRRTTRVISTTGGILMVRIAMRRYVLSPILCDFCFAVLFCDAHPFFSGVLFRHGSCL